MKPGMTCLSEGLFGFLRHADQLDDCVFEGGWIDVIVCTHMSGTARGEGNENTPVGSDQFVHRRSVGCYYESVTAHCFGDVVSPAFG